MVDGFTCDDEASVANKTRPDNQSLGAAVLVRLKRKQSAVGENNIKFERRTAIHCDTNNDFTPRRQRSTVPAVAIPDTLAIPESCSGGS